VSESVEEGGREGEGGGADTEVKTKTPHVNVGNYIPLKGKLECGFGFA